MPQGFPFGGREHATIAARELRTMVSVVSRGYAVLGEVWV